MLQEVLQVAFGSAWPYHDGAAHYVQKWPHMMVQSVLWWWGFNIMVEWVMWFAGVVAMVGGCFGLQGVR